MTRYILFPFRAAFMLACVACFIAMCMVGVFLPERLKDRVS